MVAAAEVLGERIPLVATSLENDIGTVTLSNSKNHTALSAALIADLLEAGIKLNASGAKVVILRAAPGVKVWSAGHDVKELPTNGRDPLTYDDPLRQAVRAIHETRKRYVCLRRESIVGLGEVRFEISPVVKRVEKAHSPVRCNRDRGQRTRGGS